MASVRTEQGRARGQYSSDDEKEEAATEAPVVPDAPCGCLAYLVSITPLVYANLDVPPM